MIGRYPPFRYDASSGGATGWLGDAAADGTQPLHFDPSSLVIPSLNWRTTRFLGLPLPPGISISIQPETLEGSLNARTGAVALTFKARFQAAITGFYRAPDLIVVTVLSSGESRGRRHSASGAALHSSGEAILAGVATIEPTGDVWLDRFLGLPDEALAVLRCQLSIGPSASPGDQGPGIH